MTLPATGLVLLVASDRLAEHPGAVRWTIHTLDSLLKTLPSPVTLLGPGHRPIDVWIGSHAEGLGHHRTELRPSGLRWDSGRGLSGWASEPPGDLFTAVVTVKLAALAHERDWCVEVWLFSLPGDDCTDPLLALAEAYELWVERLYVPLFLDAGPRFLQGQNARSPALR